MLRLLLQYYNILYHNDLYSLSVAALKVILFESHNLREKIGGLII